MASPPYSGATSPPSSAPLALPRQRPSLALPTSIQRRKPSITSATSSNHPLRQTSFPPADSLEAQHQQAEDLALARYSPDADDTLSLESDEDITSAVSGPAGGADDAFSRKRKRTGGGVGAGGGAEPKRARGRPPKNASLRRGSTSVINGDDARSTTAGTRRGGTAGAVSVTGDAEEDDDDEDEDEDGAGPDARAGGLVMDAAELEQENKRRYLFREAVPAAHQNRYDAYNKVKLRTSDVRRLVNATLSQSVPQNVVTVVGAYTKMFAGMLVESAREVQMEWVAVAAKQPDGSENSVLEKLKMMRSEGEDDNDDDDSGGNKNNDTNDANDGKPEETLNGNAVAQINSEGTVPSENGHHNSSPTEKMDLAENVNTKNDRTPELAQSNGDKNCEVNGHVNGISPVSLSEPDEIEHVQPGAWGLTKDVDESNRGPLLPDHLREALRRYKKSRGGGSVGFTGLSLEGRDVAAPRMGGRRLFR